MLVETLQTYGISPAEIGRVILTHAHWDHSQNTDLFPNAEIVISKRELEYSRNPKANDYATAKYFADTLSTHTVKEVSGETELEKGLGTFDTPGHTAGHQSVLVETSGGLVCLGGDAISDAGALSRGSLRSYSGAWNKPKLASRKFLKPQTLYTGSRPTVPD